MKKHYVGCAGSTVIISTLCEFDWYPTFHTEWVEWCAENGILYDTSIGVFEANEDQEFFIRMRWS